LVGATSREVPFTTTPPSRSSPATAPLSPPSRPPISPHLSMPPRFVLALHPTLWGAMTPLLRRDGGSPCGRAPPHDSEVLSPRVPYVCCRMLCSPEGFGGASMNTGRPNVRRRTPYGHAAHGCASPCQLLSDSSPAASQGHSHTVGSACKATTHGRTGGAHMHSAAATAPPPRRAGSVRDGSRPLVVPPVLLSSLPDPCAVPFWSDRCKMPVFVALWSPVRLVLCRVRYGVRTDARTIASPAVSAPLP